MTLSGTNTYTGLTTVADGTLSLDEGSIYGSVYVAAGATLSGTGTICAGGSSYTATIEGSSTLSPGNSPGDIRSDGPTTFYSGSLLYIAAEGLANGVRGDTKNARYLSPGETITLLSDAIVDVVAAAGTNYSTGVFPFMEGIISGTFSTVNIDSSNTHGLEFDVIQGSSAISLLISVAAPTRPDHLSGNAAKLFDLLSPYYNEPGLAALFQKIAYYIDTDLSGRLLNEALKMIEPARNASATFASSNAQFSALNVLSSRSATWRFWNAIGQQQPQKEISLLEEELLVSNADQPFKKGALNAPSCVLNMGRPGDRLAVWFNPFGDISHSSTAAGAEVPFHTYTGGGVMGVDACVSNCGIIETAAGAARTSIVMNQGHQTVNYYFAALNGTYTVDNFYLEAGVLGSYDQIENKRYINFIDINRTASSSHDMWQLTPQLSFGYLCWAASWGLEPFIAEDWVFNFEQQMTEYGAVDFDTSIAGRNSSLLRSEIGLNIYKDYTFTNKSVLLFRATGAYVNKVPFSMGKMRVDFYQTSIASFEVDSFNKTQNLGTAGVEFVYGATNGMFGSLQYDGEFGKGYSANELQVQVGYSF